MKHDTISDQPVDVIILMVGWLKQLEVHFPHDPHSETPVIQELVDPLLDLLGGHNGLHHDASVRVLLSIEVTVMNS